MVKLKQTQKVRCPRCNSLQTYLRLQNKEVVCRSCGAVTKMFDSPIDGDEDGNEQKK